MKLEEASNLRQLHLAPLCRAEGKHWESSAKILSASNARNCSTEQTNSNTRLNRMPDVKHFSKSFSKCSVRLYVFVDVYWQAFSSLWSALLRWQSSFDNHCLSVDPSEVGYNVFVNKHAVYQSLWFENNFLPAGSLLWIMPNEYTRLAYSWLLPMATRPGSFVLEGSYLQAVHWAQ